MIGSARAAGAQVLPTSVQINIINIISTTAHRRHAVAFISLITRASGNSTGAE